MSRNATRAVLAAAAALTLAAAGCSSSKTAAGSSTSSTSAAKSAQPSTSLSTPTKSTINIGVPGTSTGIFASIYGSYPAVVSAWEQWTNAHGGLDGHPVKTFYMDDGGNPAKTLSNITTMVTQDHVVAFAMVFLPLTGQVLANYATQHHIPVIGDEGSEVAAVTDPNWFSWAPSPTHGDPAATLAGAKYITGATKIGFIYCLEAPICKNSTEAMKAYAPTIGVSIVSSQGAASTTADFTAQVINAKDAGAQVIIPYMSDVPSAKIAQALAQQGMAGKLFGAADITDPGYYAAGSYTNGTYVDSHEAAITSSVFADARQAMKQYSPSTPLNQGNAQEWVSGQLLALAAKNLSGPVTGAQLESNLKAARNFTLGGLIAPITFPATGNKTDTNVCDQPLKVQNGALVPAISANTFVCGTAQGIKVVTSSASA